MPSSNNDAQMTEIPNVSISVSTNGDVARSALATRKFARAMKFDEATELKVATAISELATNIVRYAQRGTVTLHVVVDSEYARVGRYGLGLIVADRGPGITDIENAMKDGATTRDSLGLGLPGVKRLMDEFELISAPGKGTVVKATKWKT